MAENKKGLLLYADYKTTVDKLIERDRVNGTNNAGELFCHILDYVNHLNPVPVNDTIDLIFEPINYVSLLPIFSKKYRFILL